MAKKNNRVTAFQLSLDFRYLVEKKNKFHLDIAEAIKHRQFHGKAFTNKLALLYQLKAQFPVTDESVLSLDERAVNILKQHNFQERGTQRQTAISAFDKEVTNLQTKLLKQHLPIVEAIQSFITLIENTRMLRLDDLSADSLLEHFALDLAEYSKDFVEGKISYPDYKQRSLAALAECNTTLPQILKHRPRTLLEHLVNVIRNLLNLIDKVTSWTLGVKPMEKTSSLFAKTLTGRNHFFNRPEVNLQQDLQKFEKSLEFFDVPVCSLS